MLVYYLKEAFPTGIISEAKPSIKYMEELEGINFKDNPRLVLNLLNLQRVRNRVGTGDVFRDFANTSTANIPDADKVKLA